ncbi:UDP-glycosyltransferase UGT5-like isoform X2 [Portunus trituberculatus]|uniref:UDP-glycosyltransferase UGT5-like isoform X2 n=1 Tax=Portunus trituberculatus TaxID=210409 RepID=UPI001E1D1085|nr:UDP-glycosyltransferase UGT5-like isoform X2 [Portunus trituberculatus]
MVCTACVVAAALVWSAAGLLAPPQKNYSILMLIPYWGKSHRNVFMPLSEALADRGHKVVMLTMVPESSTHPNITEVSFSLANVNVDSSNMFDLLGTSIRTTYMPIIAREMYKLPCVKKLYKERKQFDLIVVDYSFSQIWQHFPDLPPLMDIERNQSLTLMNTHFSISTPMPLLPSQVEVGAMHCRPAKPLPQDLKAWVTGAGSAGVVYFSLGSTASGMSIPSQYRQIFLEVFRRLPQRVLWKYEGELEGMSDNVRISRWLPQQDLLAHCNVKVFISHGGLLSLQESIFHATPLLILPIYGDQFRNGMFVDGSDVGRTLMWKELTVDRIVEALTDIITNPKYQKNVARLSATLRDQLTTPQERAVFWTEYVIRHRGAVQLRCPAADHSWVEFLLLDVMGLLLLGLLLLLFFTRRILRAISTKIFDGYPKQKTA